MLGSRGGRGGGAPADEPEPLLPELEGLAKLAGLAEPLDTALAAAGLAGPDGVRAATGAVLGDAAAGSGPGVGLSGISTEATRSHFAPAQVPAAVGTTGSGVLTVVRGVIASVPPSMADAAAPIRAVLMTPSLGATWPGRGRYPKRAAHRGDTAA
jgi:hypothetical protein